MNKPGEQPRSAAQYKCRLYTGYSLTIVWFGCSWNRSTRVCCCLSGDIMHGLTFEQVSPQGLPHAQRAAAKPGDGGDSDALGAGAAAAGQHEAARGGSQDAGAVPGLRLADRLYPAAKPCPVLIHSLFSFPCSRSVLIRLTPRSRHVLTRSRFHSRRSHHRGLKHTHDGLSRCGPPRTRVLLKRRPSHSLLPRPPTPPPSSQPAVNMVP